VTTVPADTTADERLTVRPRSKFAWIWASVWLIYLIQPVSIAWQEPDLGRRALALATIAGFSAVFVVTFARHRSAGLRGEGLPVAWRWASIAVALVLAVAVTVTIRHPSGFAPYPFIAVMMVFLLPARAAIAGVLLLLLGITVAQRVTGWGVDYSVQFGTFVAALAMWGVLQVIERNRQLALAREELAELAVADERNRFARDLHDILGHSLTVVAVKAELAGRLVRTDPDRAEQEIASVEELARQALADVRSAVAGYRDVTLAGELAGARAALDAAGIDAELPRAIDNVPPDRRELFGWAVREGVTNVIRHSGASRCRVRVTADEVEISDDGRGPSPAGAGHGLAGLRERAEAAGGSLTVGRSPLGGFSLAVRT
jgi:two-component system sensor histidine kinase DesK